MENKHLNTLKAEEAARKAKEAKTEAEAKAKAEKEKAEAVKKEIEDREEASKVEEKYGVTKTYELVERGEILEVRLKLLDCPEGFPIGAASSEADADAMVNTLRKYAPNGKLLYKSDVMTAISRSQTMLGTAHDLKEAEIRPERAIWVDGVEFYTRGDEIRRASDSKLIHTVNGLDRLDDALIEQLVVPALRNILSEMEKSEAEHEENDEEVFYLYGTHSDGEDFIGSYDSLEEAQAAAEKLENDCDYTGWYIEDQDGEVIDNCEW